MQTTSSVKSLLLALVLCGVCASPAFAQSPPVVNPGGVEFDASPDHAAVANGAPVLTKYTLEIAAQTAPSVVVKSVDLGKPAVSNSKVTVAGLDPVFATLPAGNYIAAVKAEGPGGASTSVPTDPFTVKPRAPGAPGKPAWKQ